MCYPQSEMCYPTSKSVIQHENVFPTRKRDICSNTYTLVIYASPKRAIQYQNELSGTKRENILSNAEMFYPVPNTHHPMRKILNCII